MARNHTQARVPMAEFEFMLNRIRAVRPGIKDREICELAGYNTSGGIFAHWRKQGEAPKIGLMALRAVLHDLRGEDEIGLDASELKALMERAQELNRWDIVASIARALYKMGA